MSVHIKGPACIVCDGCQAVLANNGQSIAGDVADGNKLVRGFPSNDIADEAALSAGWSVTFGEYEPGEVNFRSPGEHYCPKCRKERHR